MVSGRNFNNASADPSSVFMIRVTSVHILFLIALYERQSYQDQGLMEQLGDFAERYVGSLPRRLKAAGNSFHYISCVRAMLISFAII